MHTILQSDFSLCWRYFYISASDDWLAIFLVYSGMILKVKINFLQKKNSYLFISLFLNFPLIPNHQFLKILLIPNKNINPSYVEIISNEIYKYKTCDSCFNLIGFLTTKYSCCTLHMNLCHTLDKFLIFVTESG